MKPDPRRTKDAVKRVRAVYPGATQFGPNRAQVDYYVREGWAPPGKILGIGRTAKSAWWNAVPKALDKALTS